MAVTLSFLGLPGRTTVTWQVRGLVPLFPLGSNADAGLLPASQSRFSKKGAPAISKRSQHLKSQFGSQIAHSSITTTTCQSFYLMCYIAKNKKYFAF